jgi:Holliday junction DNA helicase RuvB
MEIIEMQRAKRAGISLLTSVLRFIRDLFPRTGDKTNFSFENVHGGAKYAHNEDEDEASLAFEGLSKLIASGESRSNLERAIRNARERSDPLDHLLLMGSEKLAKAAGTIIARELGVNIHVTSGAGVKTAADLAALLTYLEDKDVLLIHGIDRLDPEVEELICSAMEKFMLPLLIGEGTNEREVTVDLARFTLVGSTSAEDRVPSKVDEQFPVTIELLSETD